MSTTPGAGNLPPRVIPLNYILAVSSVNKTASTMVPAQTATQLSDLVESASSADTAANASNTEQAEAADKTPNLASFLTGLNDQVCL